MGAVRRLPISGSLDIVLKIHGWPIRVNGQSLTGQEMGGYILGGQIMLRRLMMPDSLRRKAEDARLRKEAEETNEALLKGVVDECFMRDDDGDSEDTFEKCLTPDSESQQSEREELEDDADKMHLDYEVGSL